MHDDAHGYLSFSGGGREPYRAIIMCRKHSSNGKWFAAERNNFSFYVAEPMPLRLHNISAPLDAEYKAERVTLHYGTFNGVPVWTEEPVNT